MSPVSLSEVVRGRLRLLGPGGEPPGAVVKVVVRLLETKAPALATQVLAGSNAGSVGLEELLIAFGLGWGRLVHPLAWRDDGAGWDGVWGTARRWLEAQVWRAMRSTARYLEFGLCIEGYAFREHPEMSPAVAQRLVHWLIQGSCPCPVLHWEGMSESRFILRIARCLRAHSVAGWNPAACSFLDFVWQAVKGPMARRARLGNFSPKALAQGMHFWNLYHESHLRLADVLVWSCERDQSLNFEGLPCLECLNQQRGEVLDLAAFRTVVPRLVIPQVYDGRYVEAVYWHCQHCRKPRYPDLPFFPGAHYYPEHLDLCPKCGKGRTPGAKRSHVFLLDGQARMGWRRRDPGEDTVSSIHAGGSSVWDPAVAGVAYEPPGADSRREELREALAELEPQARRVLELRYFEQLTPIEAAQAMRVSPAKARELEAAAKEQLRGKMHIKEETDEQDGSN